VPMSCICACVGTTRDLLAIPQGESTGSAPPDIESCPSGDGAQAGAFGAGGLPVTAQAPVLSLEMAHGRANTIVRLALLERGGEGGMEGGGAEGVLAVVAGACVMFRITSHMFVRILCFAFFSRSDSLFRRVSSCVTMLYFDLNVCLIASPVSLWFLRVFLSCVPLVCVTSVFVFLYGSFQLSACLGCRGFASSCSAYPSPSAGPCAVTGFRDWGLGSRVQG
jgi:hypothetical protein